MNDMFKLLDFIYSIISIVRMVGVISILGFGYFIGKVISIILIGSLLILF